MLLASLGNVAVCGELPTHGSEAAGSGICSVARAPGGERSSGPVSLLSAQTKRLSNLCLDELGQTIEQAQYAGRGLCRRWLARGRAFVGGWARQSFSSCRCSSLLVRVTSSLICQTTEISEKAFRRSPYNGSEGAEGLGEGFYAVRRCDARGGVFPLSFSSRNVVEQPPLADSPAVTVIVRPVEEKLVEAGLPRQTPVS